VSGAKVLLVDDDPAVLRGVSGLLRDEGYRTVEARDAAAAWAALHAPRDLPGMMLLDLRLPGESGLELLERLPKPLALPVVVLSGEAKIADTVRALKLGATDFVEKPPSPERLLTAVRNALALSELQEERERLRQELSRPGHLVGESAAIDELRRQVAKAGATDVVVLITGETGTGKERVARALHLASGRRGRFVAVNCAAIPATLLESELFGYEKGAFSGAAARRLGRIEQAHGGTLLLDEIGDMPLELQAKILRAIEEREVERLGGAGPVAVDVRVLASTHRDLQQAVKQGGFREDLFYRLNVVPIAVPPLRQRPDDVLPLARAFAADLLGPSVAVEFSPEAVAALRAYDWPGNVRELRNFVERVSLGRSDGSLRIGAEAVALLRPAGRGAAAAALGEKSYPELLADFERTTLRAALDRSGGNIAAAARLLRMDRGNLHRRLKALDLIE
jgi:DNA-binding NtrC family response regulator